MKRKDLHPILLASCLLIGLNAAAQKSSKLTPESLLFSDAATPFAGALFHIGGINIQNGFNITSITDNSVSAGSDLLQTSISGKGLTVQDFAVFPASNSNLNRKQLTFETEGAGLVGLDRETWRLGITNVGEFSGSSPVQSAFSLRYNRIIDDVAILYPIFYVNPQEGNMGMGTFDQNFQAQLYVEEFGQDQVGVWSENVSISNSPRWGIFSSSEGTGSGLRYGVVGQGQNSTGVKYGLYGQTTGSGTRYGVFSNGDMAYTGTLTDVSDIKFKKNIRNFSALDRVLQLRPKTYEMKHEEFKRMNLASGQRFGFIAQDLREVFPELVREQVNAIPYQGEGDSLAIEEIQYLGVDYISMVPVLTQAMQEQQKMIEEKDERITRLEREYRTLQQENAALEDRLDQMEVMLQQLIQNTPGAGNANSATLNEARLLQNQPNPSGNRTRIPHFIPDAVQSASLTITDAQGRVLQTIAILNRGDGQTILDTDQLSSGVYFYSLVLDGQVVDTKQMVVN